MADDAVRTLERTLAASPGDKALRERLAALLMRRGERARACEVLHVHLRVDLADLPALSWRRKELTDAEVTALVEDDLAALDPVRLATAWPCRRDGAWRLSTVRFLRRYDAYVAGRDTHRLVLVAFTPGTGGRLGRGIEQRGARVLQVVLGVRDATHKFVARLLPPTAWRSG
jgi:hypothetical protein